MFALPGQDDLVLIVRRIEALGKFLDTDDGKNLLAGTKRAANILRIEEKKDNTAYTGAPDAALLQQPEEKELARAIGVAKAEADQAVAKEDFAAAMTAMAKLRPHVDAFFDKVTVNVDDKALRANRLQLLNEIREATRAVADFSKIEGYWHGWPASGHWHNKSIIRTDQLRKRRGRVSKSPVATARVQMARQSVPQEIRKPVVQAAKPRKPAAKPRRQAAPKSGQWVYTFGGGKAEGRSGMKDLLGGKGANLAEMANLGLPVPPGFTITTEVCTYYYANKQTYPKDLEKQVDAGLAHIAKVTGRRFGDRDNPLLVSVRSGARASMPGMMDTVLNLGLNDETVEALAQQSGDRRFAYDSYRRFIQMYSNVVLDIEHHNFEDILEDHKSRVRLHARHRTDRRRLGRRGRALQGARRARRRASRSRRTRASSSGARSARCSARG